MIYPLLRSLLFTIPPEAAHNLTIQCLKAGQPLLPLLKPFLQFQSNLQEKQILGIRFPNPVGLAAGMDKDASCPMAWQNLGFGFAEIGTFTARPQPGNPKPRVFRLKQQQCLINRFGFNNSGADVIAARLQNLKNSGRWPRIPLGINIGKSKVTPLEEAVQDYLYSLDKLKDFADYIALNISSPNTPGLRQLQDTSAIRSLISPLRKEARKQGQPIPLFVKLAPDMSEKELFASVDAALESGVDGLILTNTTLGREGLPEAQWPEGGLSGSLLMEKSTRLLGAVVKHTSGRIPVIGVGGILSVDDAKRKLDAGASLIQLYTGFIYQGPTFPSRINQYLHKMIKRSVKKQS